MGKIAIGTLLAATLWLCCPPSVCHGAEWVEVVEGHQIDSGSVRTIGQQVSFYVRKQEKFLPGDHQTGKTKGLSGYTITGYTLICGVRFISFTSCNLYNNDGSLVWSVDEAKPKVKDVIPDSVGELYYKILCPKQK